MLTGNLATKSRDIVKAALKANSWECGSLKVEVTLWFHLAWNSEYCIKVDYFWAWRPHEMWFIESHPVFILMFTFVNEKSIPYLGHDCILKAHSYGFHRFTATEIGLDIETLGYVWFQWCLAENTVYKSGMRHHIGTGVWQGDGGEEPGLEENIWKCLKESVIL